MQSALFFSQLKTYCYEVENDAKRLRLHATGPTADGSGMFDLSHIDKLNIEVQERATEFEDYQRLTCRSHVHSVEEITDQCTRLHNTNCAMLLCLEKHLQKYSNGPVTKLSTTGEASNIEVVGSLLTEAAVVDEDTPGCASPVVLEAQQNIYDTDKTPTFEEMKISAATKRVLMYQERDMQLATSCLSSSCVQTNDSQRPVKDSCLQLPVDGQYTPAVSLLKNQSGLAVQCSDIEYSVSPKTPKMVGPLHNFPFQDESFIQQEYNTTHSNLQESLLFSSPHTDARNLDTSSLSDPATPELSPSALNITTLKNIRREVSDVESKHCNDGEPNTSTIQKHLPPTDLFDSDILDALDTFSPPRTSKMLQPRRAATGEVCDNRFARTDWIPAISASEWEAAPSFLKIQMSPDSLNAALHVINRKIEETMTQAPHTSGRNYVESFSQEELERLMQQDICISTPLKIILLGLVHLKRLDICTENSIKVYKARKYY